MPARNGQVAQGFTYMEQNPLLSSDLGGYGGTSFIPDLPFDAGESKQGNYSSYRVPEATPWAINVQRAPSFFEDFYNRIHVTPSVIPLGDILANQSRNAEVWNSHLSPKLLSSIAGQDIGELVLTEPFPAPTVFKPNEFRIYQIGIPANGTPTVNANYVFKFPGESPSVKITGRRITLFPWPADFAKGIVETLEWKTEILKSYSGVEQRRGLRDIPRRTFEFSVVLTQLSSQRFNNLMWGAQSKTFAVPVWQDKRYLTAGAALGTKTLSCDTSNVCFQVGGLAVLYVSETLNEVVEVAAINPSSIVTSQPLGFTWPLSTEIYPAVLGHLPTSANVQRHTDNTLSAQCVFKTSPDVTDACAMEGVTPNLYDGIEVVLDAPDWGSGLSQQYTHQFNETDFGVGAIRWSPVEKNPKRVTPYSWLLSGRQTISDFRSFAARRRGQLKPVWLPSWTDDFTILSNTTAVAPSIEVVDNLFMRQVGVNTTNDRVMIRTAVGTFYRRITSIGFAADGVNTALFLDSPLGVAVAKNQVLAIHMLKLSRLATDKVSLVWHTDSVVQVASNFTTIDK